MEARHIPVACLAPPLTDELLKEYSELAAACEDLEVKDALLTLLKCVEAWWEVEESTASAKKWLLQEAASGKEVEIPVRPLTPELMKKLWDTTPWMRELAPLSTAKGDGLFDGLPPGKLRNAAFHLLWFSKEISLDREPLTKDKVKKG